MSVNLSPLAIPQVAADGTVCFSERGKKKRADSFGSLSPTSPPLVHESTLNVITVPVVKDNANENSGADEDLAPPIAPGAKEVSSSDSSAMDESSDLESEYSTDSDPSDDEATPAKKEGVVVKASDEPQDIKMPTSPTSPVDRSGKSRSSSGGHRHGHGHHRHHSSTQHSSSRKTEEKSKHHREKSAQESHGHSHEHTSHTPRKSNPSEGSEQKPKLSRRKSTLKASSETSPTSPTSPGKHKK